MAKKKTNTKSDKKDKEDDIIEDSKKNSKQEYFLMTDGSIAEITKKFDKCSYLGGSCSKDVYFVIFKNEKGAEFVKTIAEYEIFQSFTKKILANRLLQLGLLESYEYQRKDYNIELDKAKDQIIINAENLCPRKREVFSLSLMTKKKCEITQYLEMIKQLELLKSELNRQSGNEQQNLSIKKYALMKTIKELEDAETTAIKLEFAKLDLRKTEKDIENLGKENKLKEKEIADLKNQIENGILPERNIDKTTNLPIDFSQIDDPDKILSQRLNKILDIKTQIEQTEASIKQSESNMEESKKSLELLREELKTLEKLRKENKQ